MNFYFDIETIQTQRQDFIDDFAVTITPPANIKKAETLKAWEEDKKPALIEKAVSESVFDGGMGEIIAFSCAVDDGKIYNAYRTNESTEYDLLEAINEIFKVMFFSKHGNYDSQQQATWIGHYITGFDLRFLWKRFVINRIKPAVKIPYGAKPWDKEVYDTCIEWKGTSGKDKSSMDFVCKALNIEGKNGMDGSQVYDYWKEGRYKEISEYCDSDVIRTREIYKAISFAA